MAVFILQNHLSVQKNSDGIFGTTDLYKLFEIYAVVYTTS